MIKTVIGKIFLTAIAVTAFGASAVFAQNGGVAAPAPAAPVAQPPVLPPQSAAPPAEAVQSGVGVAARSEADKDESDNAGKPGIIDAESNMRMGTEISAQALAAAPFLRSKNGVKVGNGKLLKRKDRVMFQRFDQVKARPTGGNEFTFKIGDTLDILKSGKSVSLEGKSAKVLARTGKAVVVGYAGKRIVIKLIDVWGAIVGGEMVAKSAAFTPYYCDKLIDSAGEKIQASVIFRVDDTVSPYPHQYVIIDKGSGDGVKIGDIFRVKERQRINRLSAELLDAQVVNVASNSATLVIQNLFKENLEVGDDAFLSQRAVAR